METSNALLNCDTQLLLDHLLGAILWQLQIVYAGHDTGKIVIRSQGCFVRLPDYCERWVQALESYTAYQPRTWQETNEATNLLWAVWDYL